MQTLCLVLLVAIVIIARMWFARKDVQNAKQKHKKSLEILDAQWECIHAGEDFAYAILESHPGLIHYDNELGDLAEHLAKTREMLHRAIQENHEDGYRSPLRKFLPADS